MSGRSPAWYGFSTHELERKLEELERLIDSGMLTDRSLSHQLDEIGIIQNELARRRDRDGGKELSE